jgi:O-antigen/teichoic acid export membrane protein
MTMLRNRRLVIGVVSNLAGRGLALLAPFIVFPAALTYLGEVQFGLWMMVASITSISLFVDMGIGNGLLTRLSECNGKQDTKSARSYVSSAYAALGSMAIALLVIGSIASIGGVPITWLDGGGDAARDHIRIAAVCIVAFIIGIPFSLIQRVQYAYQQVWLSNAWQAVGAVLAVIATLFTIRAELPGWIVIGVYATTPVLTLLLSTIVYFFIQQPDLTPSPRLVARHYVTDLLRLGMRFLLLSIITSISLNIDNVIIAGALGVSEVTTYAVPAKLTSALAILVTAICLPLWPANGEAIARGDFEWVRKSTFAMSIFSGVSVAVTALLLVYFGENLMLAWMGRTFPNQQGVLSALSTQVVLMAVASPFLMVLNSVGAIKFQLISWVVFLIITVPGKALAVTNYGVIGVAIVGAISYGIVILPAAIVGFFRIAGYSATGVKGEVHDQDIEADIQGAKGPSL